MLTYSENAGREKRPGRSSCRAVRTRQQPIGDICVNTEAKSARKGWLAGIALAFVALATLLGQIVDIDEGLAVVAKWGRAMQSMVRSPHDSSEATFAAPPIAPAAGPAAPP